MIPKVESGSFEEITGGIQILVIKSKLGSASFVKIEEKNIQANIVHIKINDVYYGLFYNQYREGLKRFSKFKY
jgi:hypothetical protein